MPRPPHIEEMKRALADVRRGIAWREEHIQSAERDLEMQRRAIESCREYEADLVRRINEAEEIESW